jgi:hypothetical protein
MFAQPYIPFTGCMILDFLVIALLDQNIQNWNKIGGHTWGNDDCHGGCNMSLILGS